MLPTPRPFGSTLKIPPPPHPPPTLRRRCCVLSASVDPFDPNGGTMSAALVPFGTGNDDSGGYNAGGGGTNDGGFGGNTQMGGQQQWQQSQQQVRGAGVDCVRRLVVCWCQGLGWMGGRWTLVGGC